MGPPLRFCGGLRPPPAPARPRPKPSQTRQPSGFPKLVCVVYRSPTCNCVPLPPHVILRRRRPVIGLLFRRRPFPFSSPMLPSLGRHVHLQVQPLHRSLPTVRSHMLPTDACRSPYDRALSLPETPRPAHILMRPPRSPSAPPRPDLHLHAYRLLLLITDGSVPVQSLPPGPRH